jgi:hypothetical protein
LRSGFDRWFFFAAQREVSAKRLQDGKPASPLFEIALALVRFDHVAHKHFKEIFSVL